MINVNVNPGEPLDGTGIVCIHLFVPDARGVFTEPNALHMAEVEDENGNVAKKLIAKPTRGRLACNPKRAVAPTTRGGITNVTPRTDDPRAVTCPKCRASVEYAEIMEVIFLQGK